MKALVVFLNELSFTSGSPVSQQEILRSVLSTLSTARNVRQIRNDLLVVGSVPISAIQLGDGTVSLASILGGDAHKEEWRFLQNLNQASPWNEYPGAPPPDEAQEARFQGQSAMGMLWANRSGSSILSFAWSQSWNDGFVHAQLCELDPGGNINPTDVDIRNLSKPEHVVLHRDWIHSYGRALANSSLVYNGEHFRIRIYFNDHHPLPHFHVFRPNSTESLASYAIQTLDLLAGELPPALGRRVRDWASTRREDLLRCWNRCRQGQHPFVLED
jgi:hypothetical protein